MKILLDGYIDHNLGDDLMLTLTARQLEEHELYITSDKIRIKNVTPTDKKSGFDLYLKVIGSGFLLHSSRGIVYRVRELAAEKRYAPRRAVIGCSLDAFPSRAAEYIIRKQLASYDLITVRDSFSYDYILRHASGTVCERYPDMVFSLPDSMIPDTQCEDLLGIAAHSSISPETLACLSDAYIDETGREVLLLCFNTGAENDAYVSERVFSLARNKSRIHIVRYDAIEQMLSQMKRCGCMVATRLHSAVLAARMGIPFVPIAYSDKMRRALDGVGYTGRIYEVNTSGEELMQLAMSPKEFPLDSRVITSARRHFQCLKDFIKG